MCVHRADSLSRCLCGAGAGPRPLCSAWDVQPQGCSCRHAACRKAAPCPESAAGHASVSQGCLAREMGRGEGYLCPVLSFSSFHFRPGRVYLGESSSLKISNAFCIPVYFPIPCYFSLRSHTARADVYVASVRAGGEQTRGVRSCTSWHCPSVRPPADVPCPTSTQRQQVGKTRAHLSSLWLNKRSAGAGLGAPACLWGGPSGCPSAPRADPARRHPAPAPCPPPGLFTAVLAGGPSRKYKII